MGPFRSAHRDTFARDHLPARELWPTFEYTLPELHYPKLLNCAVELLDHNIERGLGSDIAFRFPGGHCTYGELLELSNSIANLLVGSFGLIPGQRVLLRGPNNLMLVACWLAVLKAGGIVVCTLPLRRESELRFILQHAQVNLAITDERFAGELVTAAAGITPVIRFGQLQAVGASSAFANVQTSADDVAIIAYTAAAAAEPKASAHFHRDVLACCDCWPPHVLDARHDDSFCGSPPLGSTFGLGALLLFPLRIGASAVLLEQTDPPELLAAIQEFRPTLLFAAPPTYRAMLARIAEFDVSSLRKCVSAGEPLPPATAEAWQRAVGSPIIDGLYSTEMLHIFISAAASEVRPGSIGKVVPGYRARIVDENMRDVPVGEAGKLAVRGPTGCRYLWNDERQRAYVRDGWNLTADTCRMDAEGYFWQEAP